MTTPEESLPEHSPDAVTPESTTGVSPPASVKSAEDSTVSYVLASLFICGGIFVAVIMAMLSQITLEGCDEEHTCHYTAYHSGLFFTIGGPFIAILIAGLLHTKEARRAEKAGEKPVDFHSGVLWQIFGIQTLTIILAFILFSAVDPT